MVSIPNGMEFYSRFPLPLPPFAFCFNSQRDGILPNPAKTFVACQFVSIPNGMEFYWVAARLRQLAKSVSIPNGMEFYFFVVSNHSIPPGFNSQRDGILLFQGFKLLFYVLVSIPNGMEFYRKQKLYKDNNLNCFNSQRDGILLSFEYSCLHAAQSFNSQRDGILQFKKSAQKSKKSKFQFPTGWNSTNLPLIKRAFINGFNSQRDGILPKIEICERSAY